MTHSLISWKIEAGDIDTTMIHHSKLEQIKGYISINPNWRLFLLLWGLASFGLLAVIPYVLTLQKNNLQAIHLSLPLPVVISAEVLLQVLLLGILTGFGLNCAKRINLGAPILADWVEGRPPKQEYRNIWLLVALIGLAMGAMIVFIDKLVFSPIIQSQLQVNGLNLPTAPNPPIWEGLLASFYGGFTEEILLRLFLMSLLAWLGSRFLRQEYHLPSKAVMWSANIFAALVFGLAHLPTAIAIGLPIDVLEITRILLLNSLPGVVFGWLYWKQGLGSAMIAHFSGDVLIHVITPWLILS